MKITKNHIKKVLNEPIFISEKFHAKTKLHKYYPQLPYESWPKPWKTVYFKTYPRMDQILLPTPKDISDIPFSKALYNRRSYRSFQKEGLSLQQISTLLAYTVGIRDKNTKYQTGNRFYPSPGGRYTIETYFLSLHSDLPLGMYHYNLLNHSVEVLTQFSTFSVSDLFFKQPWVENASIIMLLTGVFQRNTIKYMDRGYRHVLTEAGHVGQNIYLLSAALDISCCGIGGYMDDQLNALLGVDGVNETVINVTAIGNTSIA